MGIEYTPEGVVLTSSAGGTIVDSTGLVSTTNFPFNFQQVPSQTIGTPGTILGTSTQQIILTRTANVLVMACGYFYPTTTGNLNYLSLVVDGTVIVQQAVGTHAVDTQNFSMFAVYQIAAGTSNFYLEAENNGSVTYPEVDKFYLVLGN